MAKLALGHHREAAEAGCVRAVLAELVLTFLFVFSCVGSAMAAGRLAGGADTIMGLTAVALAHALVVAVMVSAGLHVSQRRGSRGACGAPAPAHYKRPPPVCYIDRGDPLRSAADVSGGHVNPAVTFGLAVGGHITLFCSALYALAQLLGSSLACFLLTFPAGGEVTPVHSLPVGVDVVQGVLMEVLLTFSLLFSVYATVVDQRRNVGCLGPLLVGLVVGANILAGVPFSGASMNPARSFGPALAAGEWADHWVYWVGPLIGGPLAGLVYECVFMVRAGHEPLPRDDAGFRP